MKLQGSFLYVPVLCILGVVFVLALVLVPMSSSGPSSAQGSTCPPPPAGYAWDLLKGFDEISDSGFTPFRNELFFNARQLDSWELWKTDGSQTEMFDPRPWLGLTPFRDALFGWTTRFVGGPFGEVLHKTNGIGAVWLVRRIHGCCLTPFRNKLFFRAEGKLWVTDGTTDGTKVWWDIYPDEESFAALGPQLFFSADDGAHGHEVWVTSVLRERTGMLIDINPSGSSWPARFTSFDGGLFFSANDGTHGRELWVTDGTAGRTHQIDINPSGSSDPEGLTAFDDRLFFSADDGTHGRELWVTDGTVGGTYPIDINRSGSSYPKGLTVFDDRLFFVAFDDRGGRGLWAMTSAWTDPYLVGGINLHTEMVDPASLTVFDDRLFFVVRDRSNQMRTDLWATDGTTDGTCLIADFPYWQIRDFVPINGRLVVAFSNEDLWAMSPSQWPHLPPSGEPTPTFTPTPTSVPPTPTLTPVSPTRPPPTPTPTPVSPPTPTPTPVP